MTEHDSEDAISPPTEAQDRTISVAMATYNGARYVAAQIESIARQTVLPAELVVSDDGSTDDTVTVIWQLQASCPFPIRILPHEGKLGFADNFLKAAGGCRSRYIAFCDQDDVWLPDKLDRLMRAIAEDRSVLAMHRSYITDKNLNKIGVLSQGITQDTVHDALMIDPYISGWGNTMLFSSNLLSFIPSIERPLQPEDPKRHLSHDTWIYVLAAATGRISYVEKCLCLYRQHGENAVGTTRQKYRDKVRALITVPLYRFHERKNFYTKMALLFNEAASNPAIGEIDFSSASEVYAARARALNSRIQIYTAPSLVRRIRMFQQHAYEQGRDPANPGSRLSTAKDVILGIAKLGRIEISKF